MKPEQRKEFTELFRLLLQGVYADRLLAYKDEKIEFGKEIELKKGRAEVQSNIVLSDGRKVPIFYRLTNKSGQWKVYDLIIEGVSLVKNYRTQFREIIAKDSPEKLLQILRDKVGKG
jgi:phospholipid transport system substrate-binding protein